MTLNSIRKMIICAGLPRTGTTVLQEKVLPNANGISFIGKPYDNTFFDFDILRFRSVIESWDPSSPIDFQTVNILSNTLCLGLSGFFSSENIVHSQDLFLSFLKKCMQIHDTVPVYSDESLFESVIGKSAGLPAMSNEQLSKIPIPEHMYSIPIEFLSRSELNPFLRVSLVLRNPENFLKAGYSKCVDWARDKGRVSFSFESYIQAQLYIWKTKPEASRIFLASHKKMKNYVERLFEDVVISHYEELITAPNVLKVLFGQPGSWDAVSMSSLPKVNSSFGDESFRQYILSAPGIPAGMGFDEYTATFRDVLSKYKLLDYLNSQRLA